MSCLLLLRCFYKLKEKTPISNLELLPRKLFQGKKDSSQKSNCLSKTSLATSLHPGRLNHVTIKVLVVEVVMMVNMVEVVVMLMTMVTMVTGVILLLLHSELKGFVLGNCISFRVKHFWAELNKDVLAHGTRTKTPLH